MVIDLISIRILPAVLLVLSINVSAQVEIPNGNTIQGLLQLHQAEKNALEAVLSRKLAALKVKYDTQLLEREIQYQRDSKELGDGHLDQSYKLVLDFGKAPDFEDRKKKLVFQQVAELASLLEVFKLSNNKINFDRAQEKEQINQTHRSLKVSRESDRKVELNKLKEQHAANNAVIKQLFTSKKNRLYEQIKLSANSLNGEQSAAEKKMRLRQRFDLTLINNRAEKQYLKNVVHRTEIQNLRSRHKSEDNIVHKENQLLKYEQSSKHESLRASLNKIHAIELNGGTIEEYEQNQSALKGLEIVYAYNPANNKSVTSSVESTAIQSIAEQTIKNTLDSYKTPDGKHVFFPPQDDSANRWNSGQCVAGAKELFNAASTVDIPKSQKIGNASDIPTNDYVTDNFHVERDPTKPVLGSMIVWKHNSQPFGHVGVITSMNDSTITVHDANYGSAITAEFDTWGLTGEVICKTNPKNANPLCKTDAEWEFVTTNYGRYAERTFNYTDLESLNIPRSNYEFSAYIYPKK